MSLLPYIDEYTARQNLLYLAEQGPIPTVSEEETKNYLPPVLYTSGLPRTKGKIAVEKILEPPAVANPYRVVPKSSHVFRTKMNEWYVLSTTKSGEQGDGYFVRRIYLSINHSGLRHQTYHWHCTCADFSKRRIMSKTYPYCKHIWRVFKETWTVAETQWVLVPYLPEVTPFIAWTETFSDFTTYDLILRDMPEIIIQLRGWADYIQYEPGISAKGYGIYNEFAEWDYRRMLAKNT